MTLPSGVTVTPAVSSSGPSFTVTEYCQFPPPGKNPFSTVSTSVRTEDYFCLEEENFLNDVIIEFYLKYLQVGGTS